MNPRPNKRDAILSFRPSFWFGMFRKSASVIGPEHSSNLQRCIQLLPSQVRLAAWASPSSGIQIRKGKRFSEWPRMFHTRNISCGVLCSSFGTSILLEFSLAWVVSQVVGDGVGEWLYLGWLLHRILSGFCLRVPRSVLLLGLALKSSAWVRMSK